MRIQSCPQPGSTLSLKHSVTHARMLRPKKQEPVHCFAYQAKHFLQAKSLNSWRSSTVLSTCNQSSDPKSHIRLIWQLAETLPDPSGSLQECTMNWGTYTLIHIQSHIDSSVCPTQLMFTSGRQLIEVARGLILSHPKPRRIYQQTNFENMKRQQSKPTPTIEGSISFFCRLPASGRICFLVT